MHDQVAGEGLRRHAVALLHCLHHPDRVLEAALRHVGLDQPVQRLHLCCSAELHPQLCSQLRGLVQLASRLQHVQHAAHHPLRGLRGAVHHELLRLLGLLLRHQTHQHALAEHRLARHAAGRAVGHQELGCLHRQPLVQERHCDHVLRVCVCGDGEVLLNAVRRLGGSQRALGGHRCPNHRLERLHCRDDRKHRSELLHTRLRIRQPLLEQEGIHEDV
mmetsp:Transcript_141/g.480  ORF Transcript_141/g.480 Transcript_141/m.480 type:complete len:218 (-) Transcript_141:278-931(-)